MTKIVIGIGGYAFSGKDSVARVLAAPPYNAYRTYMSRPLEQVLLTIDPWIYTGGMGNDAERYSEMHARVGYDESKKDDEVRRLLQVIGTEVGREQIDEDLWLKLVKREVAVQSHAFAVVTGIRFVNELDWVERRGASIWVSRPGFDPVNDHASDNSLGEEDFDCVIVNDGTLEDLSQKVADSLLELTARGLFDVHLQAEQSR